MAKSVMTRLNASGVSVAMRHGVTEAGEGFLGDHGEVLFIVHEKNPLAPAFGEMPRLVRFGGGGGGVRGKVN
jgi:hypothetical protein